MTEAPSDPDVSEVDWLDEVNPDDETVFDPDADAPEESPPTADQVLRYFGADFDVEGLVKRLGRKEFIIPSFDPEEPETIGFEGFQRRFVWPKKQMDRFVESLLLGYPVPGIFLVELANRKYLVLDGQQRLRTLQQFYAGTYLARLKRSVFDLGKVVSPAFVGKTYADLTESDRRLLDNTFIQATIVVPTAEGGKDAVYKLFERINSSGIKLQPQEIRVALYPGVEMHFLRDLNGVEAWRALFGDRHSRLKDHELILRYLALTEGAELLRANGWDRAAAQASIADRSRSEFQVVYSPPMSSYLNHYLERHEDLSGIDREAVQAEFQAACELLNEAAGRAALRLGGRTQLNAAHTDAVLVAITLALRRGRTFTADEVADRLTQLAGNEDYVAAVTGSTSHIASVIGRLRIACEVFGSAQPVDAA